MGQHIVDATGLNCPLPVLKARKRLLALEPGERLLLIATDPATAKDVPAFCAATGHRLVEVGEDDAGRLTFLLERGQGPASP